MSEGRSAASYVLIGLGVAGLLVGALVHGLWRRPTIFHGVAGTEEKPSVWDRLSVHLLVIGAWSAGFGLIVWRGPAPEGWDVRLPGETNWPVWPAAEWIYAAGYLTPLAISWLAPTRASLRRLAMELAVLSLLSGVIFLAVPVLTPARAAADDGTLTASFLRWETGRADFAAASLPSFHVFWALLLATVLAARGRGSAVVGWIWAVGMSAACIANGAHAVADVAASWAIYPAVAAFLRRRRTPRPSPTASPAAVPPKP